MMDYTLPPALPPSALPPVEPPPVKKYWSAWATIGFSALILLIALIAQGIVGVIFAVLQFINNRQMDIQELARQLTTNGDLFSVATLATAIIGLGLILLVIKVRQGAAIKEYLALKRINVKTVLAMLGIVFLFLAISFGLSFVPKNTSQSNVMLDAYRSAGWVPLFWLAAIVFAPIFEESLFRGFLFVGLQKSKIGVVGAIILTAAPWAFLHIQYDVFQMLVLFLLGIILGVVRHRTNSLWSPLIIHSLNNLLAMVQILLQVNGVIK